MIRKTIVWFVMKLYGLIGKLYGLERNCMVSNHESYGLGRVWGRPVCLSSTKPLYQQISAYLHSVEPLETNISVTFQLKLIKTYWIYMKSIWNWQLQTLNHFVKAPMFWLIILMVQQSNIYIYIFNVYLLNLSYFHLSGSILLQPSSLHSHFP